MRKIVLILIIIFSSCDENMSSVIKISSNDNQVITIITKDTVRYIIDGDLDYIPDTGYVKLNTSQISFDYDSFFGCFEEGKYQWQLINPHSQILEIKLDTSKYEVSGRRVFKRPEILKFHTKAKCLEFTTSSLKVYGDKTLKLKRKFISLR